MNPVATIRERAVPARARRLAVLDAAVGNALPVIGVLVLRWDLLVVVFYYLLAEVVTGVVTLAKISRCTDVSPERRRAREREGRGEDPLVVPSRARFLLRTGWIVALEALVAYALSGGVHDAQRAWILVALVVLAARGLVEWLRFVRGKRWRLLTCAEVEVDYLKGFALFLAMVAVLATLAALGLSDRMAATVAVLAMILVVGAGDMWRAVGMESRVVDAAHDYAVRLAVLDASVRPVDD